MATSKLNGNHKLNGAIETLTEAASEKRAEIQKAVRQFGRKAEQTLYEGTEKVKDAAITVDRHVRKNSWAYIGGAMISALTLGFLLGKTKKDKKGK